MKIAFVIDNIQEVTPSTKLLMDECCKRKHRVYYLYPKNFTIRHNEAYGFLHPMRNKGLGKLLPLRELDVILIRTDFTDDIQNVACFLDVVDKDVLIVNGVKGIRKASNKLYITSFHEPNKPSIIPETYVSKNSLTLL